VVVRKPASRGADRASRDLDVTRGLGFCFKATVDLGVRFFPVLPDGLVQRDEHPTDPRVVARGGSAAFLDARSSRSGPKSRGASLGGFGAGRVENAGRCLAGAGRVHISERAILAAMVKVFFVGFCCRCFFLQHPAVQVQQFELHPLAQPLGRGVLSRFDARFACGDCATVPHQRSANSSAAERRFTESSGERWLVHPRIDLRLRLGGDAFSSPIDVSPDSVAKFFDVAAKISQCRSDGLVCRFGCTRNRTLAFGALTLSALSIYALIVGGFGSLFRNGELWLSVLATGVIAVLFQPLLIIFRRAANRLIYGERDDPYRAIANLGRRLEAALPPDEMLSTVVQTLAGSLKLPFVALRLQDGRVVSVGIPLATPVEFALLVNGAQVGQLEVSPRHANEVFALSERRLLSDLANRAAVAVQEVQLLDALRQSREALVLAREEERKRLRRDLHDGLGPTLVGVSFSLEASRMLLDSDRAHDRARADALLASSGLRIEEAIADIRRLVDDLRPPALDDLGLCGAIQQRADQFVSLRPILEFESLPALPAAVEVAAFRITCEALNNAIKHARASSVRVQVRIVDHGLDLQISDDGVGLSEHRREGAGLQTMRERALELGGRFEVKSFGDGTRVSAWLPVRAQ
jgi:signal transduction histidine kinase